MVRSDALLQHWDADVRFLDLQSSGGPSELLAGAFKSQVLVIGGPDCSLTEKELAPFIERQKATAETQGIPIEWRTWAHDPMRDLPRMLTDAGFVAGPKESLVVAPTPRIASVPNKDLPAGLSAREVEANEDIETLVRTALGDDLTDPSLPTGVSHLVQLGGTTVVVVETDSRAVGIGWVVCHDATEFAALVGGRTHPDWRERGIQTFLVIARAKIAQRKGVPFLYSEATNHVSQGNLLKVGFRVVSQVQRYSWTSQ